MSSSSSPPREGAPEEPKVPDDVISGDLTLATGRLASQQEESHRTTTFARRVSTRKNRTTAGDAVSDKGSIIDQDGAVPDEAEAGGHRPGQAVRPSRKGEGEGSASAGPSAKKEDPSQDHVEPELVDRMDVIEGGEMPEEAEVIPPPDSPPGEQDADAEAAGETERPQSQSSAAGTSQIPASEHSSLKGSALLRKHRPPSLLSVDLPNKKAAATIQASNMTVDQPVASTLDSASVAHAELPQDMAFSAHESEEEEGEEPEPLLKYQRLKGSVGDILKKDSASAFAICDKFIALGTHAGMVFVLDFKGGLIKAFKSHSASVLDLEIDSTMEFVAAAGMDGLLSISSLNSSEHYAFDFKRPMRAVSLEPAFGRKTSRAVACGGMAGALVHREKGWLGHKETVLHAGEGPIWSVKWRNNLIAWASDRGVRIFDTNTRQKITFISAPKGEPRGDMYRCNLFWQNDRMLIIAWADQIKIAKVKERESRGGGASHAASNIGLNTSAQLYVEISKVFQLDCAISGIAQYGPDLLVLAYLTESDSEDEDSDPESSRRFKRRIAQRPELRIIDIETGEEKSSDVLSLAGYERFNCNDYHLAASHDVLRRHALRQNRNGPSTKKTDRDEDVFYLVSPRDIILARPRDEKDHIEWLLEHKKYETALSHVEAMGSEKAKASGFDRQAIGREYLDYLVDELADYDKASRVGTKILGRDEKAWEDWIFRFLEKGQLGTIVDVVPTEDPVLTSVVYDMILSHFLRDDLAKLKHIVNTWPPEIYSTQAVALAIEDRLQSSPTLDRSARARQKPWTEEKDEEQTMLMEILADLYVRNGQPGKSLTYYLRLRRPGVFDLIRDNNLFLDIRDQARQLIEFEEAVKGEAAVTAEDTEGPVAGQAVQILVDHVHSIPIPRVVSQLEAKPRYLHQYLDALFNVDPQLVTAYSDVQVGLYADFAYSKLIHYLRAMSSYYSFEKAFRVCEVHDYVPEMVFLLGRIGDNKRALTLIIERLNDVNLAIDFAKEQGDDDLWEDLLRYSESKPPFIRALLENVGGVAEIDPIKLIGRIQNGLDIPGLKPALIKILQDFSLQISLLEGCIQILHHDVRNLGDELHVGQTHGYLFDILSGASGIVGQEGAGSRSRETSASLTSKTSGAACTSCRQALFSSSPHPQQESYAPAMHEAGDEYPSVVFLCRHAYHLSCLLRPEQIPKRKQPLNTSSTAAAAAGGAAGPNQENMTTATQLSSLARAASASVSSTGHVHPHTSSTAVHLGTTAGQSLPSGAVTASTRGASASAEGMREAMYEQRERSRGAYSARLRAMLKVRGCPVCRKIPAVAPMAAAAA